MEIEIIPYKLAQCSLTAELTDLSFPRVRLVILELGWKCSCEYEERRVM